MSVLYHIPELVDKARQLRSSDIHIVCGIPIRLRIDGSLQNLDDNVMTHDDCENYARELSEKYEEIIDNLSLRFNTRTLFENVNIEFKDDNCYGIIGANGAGKSTFLKILSGEIDSTKGEVILGKNERISTLRQNHNEQMTLLKKNQTQIIH